LNSLLRKRAEPREGNILIHHIPLKHIVSIRIVLEDLGQGCSQWRLQAFGHHCCLGRVERKHIGGIRISLHNGTIGQIAIIARA
jgi:hypothetical protein